MTSSSNQIHRRHQFFLITLHLMAWMYVIMAVQSRPWYDVLFGAGLLVLFVPTAGNLRYLQMRVSADAPPDERRATSFIRYAGLTLCVAALVVQWMSS